MQPLYSWSWVEAQVTQTIALWDSAATRLLDGAQYTRQQQQEREKAYDQGLRAVEREMRKAPRPRQIASTLRIVSWLPSPDFLQLR